MVSLYLIGFVVLFVLFYSLLIKLRARKAGRSAKVGGSFVLPVDEENRRYMAENVPALLVGFNVFVPAFLSRFSAEYLASGHFARFNADDLVEGVDPRYASWVLNHCCRLASGRYNNFRVIHEAQEAEAKSITLKVQSSNSTCQLVPKEKIYKLDEDIPLFPCAECKEDKICNVWYKLDF